MNSKENSLGILFILLSAILFSLGGVLIKAITWSSITINGTRNLLAAIVMYLYIKKIHHKIIFNKMVLLGAICNLLTNLTFVMATKLTLAANAIVLQFTAPLFLLLYIWIMFKKKPDKKAVTACLLVFVGIICFFIDKISFKGQIGNLLAILSGALYGIIFMLKRIKDSDFESSILISQIASFILFIPWYCKETDFAPVNFLLILILGVVQMGMAYVFLAKGLNSVTPVTAVLTSTIEPILNPVWVALFCGELISPLAAVGAAIVIVSSTIYNVLNAYE
jgi:EamA-like transporter family.